MGASRSRLWSSSCGEVLAGVRYNYGMGIGRALSEHLAFAKDYRVDLGNQVH